MNVITFAKAKELEDRICQLNLLKEYLKITFEEKPVNISFGIKTAGYKATLPVNINYGMGVKWMSDGEDGKYILEGIDVRIDSLQKEFDAL